MNGVTLDPTTIIILLVSLTMAPFALLMVSSFVKIASILSLVRNALGVQQVPPNLVLNGLAILLTIYIMYPVMQETFDVSRNIDFDMNNIASLEPQISEACGPLKKFLERHTKSRGRAFFLKTAQKIWPEEMKKDLKEGHLLVLIPAFVVSELTDAFQIGFLLYLPFIAIDMIVSNILLAMGMMMVSPMTISLPFKMMLFVLIDGWTKIVEGIVKTY
ncbi:MAG: type III secretion system export apparatus subunit SctR [Verrucomicrobiota bacterium]|nr:type III secretion system export apparatus subunit SctR [Opitutales bacterium]UPA28190.1 MAG: type III secretion system export apparatus subunit SctR [Verrucomicrobiota bacterium]